MSAALQELVVDGVVLAAVAWLVWSFGPESWRARLARRRRGAPAEDVALRADGLDGRAPGETAAGCGCAPAERR